MVETGGVGWSTWSGVGGSVWVGWSSLGVADPTSSLALSHLTAPSLSHSTPPFPPHHSLPFPFPPHPTSPCYATGTYQRVVRVTDEHVETIEPTTGRVTNRWRFDEVLQESVE